MTDFNRPGSAPNTDFVRAQTRVLQIIVGSLVAGVLIFTGYVIFAGNLQKPPQGHLLSYLALGMAMTMVVLHVVLPGVVERAALANQPVGTSGPELTTVFVTRTIIACALLEGAAMMSVVALMMEHQLWVLGVTAVLVVLMLLQIPSRTKVEQWLESRQMDRDTMGG